MPLKSLYTAFTSLKFPVVIKKEWRVDEVTFGEACGSYHYHAVATNEGLTHKNYQEVIEDYRSRADVESMIKEFKINFDAKHLPCQKFMANEMYFLCGRRQNTPGMPVGIF